MRQRGSVWVRHRIATDGTPYTRWVASVSRGPRGKRKTLRRLFETETEARAALPGLIRRIDSAARQDTEPEIVTRFYSHVEKGGHPGGCWEWVSYRYPTGYGHFSRDGKTEYAHRVALEMHIGRPLEAGEWALHRCDNPACVRVDADHVYLGTPKDNARDRLRRTA